MNSGLFFYALSWWQPMAFTWWNSLGKRTCLETSGGSGSRKRFAAFLDRVIMHACAVPSMIDLPSSKTKMLCQVYAVAWWMMHYDHPTPKRQQARSNWKGVLGLDLGSIPAAVMREKTQFQSTRVVPSSRELEEEFMHEFFLHVLAQRIFLPCTIFMHGSSSMRSGW